MAQEIKNTFLKAKMNKDLDDRIIPNGEYRDALNVSVGKSEADNVGSLENMLGNKLLTQTDIGNGYEIIGSLVDSTNDKIYMFVTNYTDPDPQAPTDAPSTSLHHIYMYDTVNDAYNLLVTGHFLNFSKTNRIIGINLIEQLLFWTDDRNQPRKINIESALRTQVAGGGSNAKAATATTDEPYYTKEHQISVAKYAPYEVITMYNSVRVVNLSANPSYITIDGDRVEEMEAFIGATVVSAEEALSGNDYTTVTGVNIIGNTTRISITPVLPNTPTVGSYFTFITSTMSNESDNELWPGDPDYLEDRFVRFSYRFKYDDNEYSLMAPFTQIAFIPKQKGYWLNGQENDTAKSTVVDWFENEVQNIKLNIPLPTRGRGIGSDYKISELEILFRESDTVAVKVLESISVGEVASAAGQDNIYVYDYQSRKPYRALPEEQTVRVYDKVPVRAQSQETSGNRVIYGNYRDMHTPPALLNYNCRISRKNDTSLATNFVEYPNHTLKRNRNYQIGFVLSDKFGRTSPVILSNIDKGTIEGGVFYSGSTIYSPYDADENGTPDIMKWFGDSIEVVVNEQIKSVKNQSSGTPGLYAEKLQRDSSAEGFAIADFVIVSNTTSTFELNTSFANNVNVPDEGDYLRGEYVDFVKVTAVTTGNNINYTVNTDGQVSSSYLRTENLPADAPDLKFAYRINDLGWYSYKIVVKQTEQDYYNVYTPGILNGYPGQAPQWYLKDRYLASDGETYIEIKETKIDLLFPTDELDVTAHVALFNDNINKIPRDLAEVGPDQKQYRSSVTLYGRVTNTMEPADGYTWDLTFDGGEPAGGGWEDAEHLAKASNVQYYPRTEDSGILAIKHTATQVANARDFGMGIEDLSISARSVNSGGTYDGLQKNEQPTGGQDVFYGINSNPLIAKISTAQKGIGWTNTRKTDWPNNGRSIPPTEPQNMWPYLAIYETAPVESNLDIYWETATSGLIVDLNTAVASTAGGAVAFENFEWDWSEDMQSGARVTPATGGQAGFEPLTPTGNPYALPCDCQLVGVYSNLDLSTNIENLFELVETGNNTGQFFIRFVKDSQPFLADSHNRDVYSFDIRVTTPDGYVDTVTIVGEPGGIGALKNIAPSFGDFTPNNIEIEGNDDVVLPASAYNDVSNGAFAGGIGQFDDTQIKYSFEGINGTVIPGSGEGLWEINSATGEITCRAGETSQGTYNLRIKIEDANAANINNNDPDYGSLSATRDLTVFLGYPAVNPGSLSSSQFCTLDPDQVTQPFDNVLTQDGVGSVNGIWYVSQNGYTEFNLGNATYKSFSDPNGDTKVWHLGNSQTGFESHKSGTIAFEVNFRTDSDVVGTGTKTGTLEFYYKAGNGDWTLLESTGNKLKEYNKTYISFPIGTEPTNIDGDMPADAWWKVLRAYDFIDFTASNPIEYCILLKNMESFNAGSISAWVGSDDLHYPTCIPYPGTLNNDLTGINQAYPPTNTNDFGGATSSTGRPIYKYFRSLEGNNSRTGANVDITKVLYAETPYTEYVNSFFTDVDLTDIYTPGSQANPNINFTYAHDQGDGNDAVRWRVLDATGTAANIRMVAGFNDIGVKIKDTSTDAFLHAKQTTYVAPGEQCSGIFPPTRYYLNL